MADGGKSKKQKNDRGEIPPLRYELDGSATAAPAGTTAAPAGTTAAPAGTYFLYLLPGNEHLRGFNSETMVGK